MRFSIALFVLAAILIILCERRSFATPSDTQPVNGDRFTLLGSINGAAVGESPFSEDNKYIVTRRGSFNNWNAQVWSIENLKAVSKPLGHEMVHFAKFTPDSGKLITADTAALKYWDIATSTLHSSVDVSAEGILGVVMSDDCNKFVITETAGRKNLWRMPETRPSLTFSKSVVDAAFDRSGRLLVTRAAHGGDLPSLFQIWDTQRGVEAVHAIGTDLVAIAYGPTAAFSDDGKRVALLRDKGFLIVDTNTGKTLSTAELLKADVRSKGRAGAAGRTNLEQSGRSMSQIGWNISEDFFWTTTQLWPYSLDLGDDSFQIWNGGTARLLRTIPLQNGFTTVSRDGKWIVFVGADGGELWSASTGQKIQTFDVTGCDTAAISPDSRTIAFANTIDGASTTTLWHLSPSERRRN